MTGSAEGYKSVLLEEKEEEVEEGEKGKKEERKGRVRRGGEGKREGEHPWLRLCKVVPRLCYSPVHKVTDLGVKSYRSSSQLCHQLAAWPWKNHIPSQGPG